MGPRPEGGTRRGRGREAPLGRRGGRPRATPPPRPASPTPTRGPVRGPKEGPNTYKEFSYYAHRFFSILPSVIITLVHSPPISTSKARITSDGFQGRPYYLRRPGPARVVRTGASADKRADGGVSGEASCPRSDYCLKPLYLKVWSSVSVILLLCRLLKEGDRAGESFLPVRSPPDPRPPRGPSSQPDPPAGPERLGELTGVRAVHLRPRHCPCCP